jgi:hypothetical protein
VAEVARSHDALLSRCSWGLLLARKLHLEAYMRRCVLCVRAWVCDERGE